MAELKTNHHNVVYSLLVGNHSQNLHCLDILWASHIYDCDDNLDDSGHVDHHEHSRNLKDGMIGESNSESLTQMVN